LSIFIKVSDLVSKALEIQSDGLEFVELLIIEEDGDLPACVSFHATSKGRPDMVDYEEIEAVDESLV